MAVSGGRAAALEGAGHVLSLREISDKTLEPQTSKCVSTFFLSDKSIELRGHVLSLRQTNFLSSPV